MALNTNSTVALNYGLNTDSRSTSSLIDFKIDLGYSNVLINLNAKDCLEQDFC